MAKRYLEGRRVILHTDKARSYQLRVKGVLHDMVIHKKRRVKRNGKTFLARPKYVKLKTHRLPGGQKRRVKAGTQIIDRVWQSLKKHLGNSSAQPGSAALSAKLREAQWRYWHQNEDLWGHAASVFQEHMEHALN